VLLPVFAYLLLERQSYGPALAILIFSGASDWADGKIARLLANQSSRLGELLDPLVDRIYMVAVPVVLALAGVVPWWVVAVLLGRDALLAATLPVLRSRGVTALPVTYIGKAATFALMSGFPLILLGQWDSGWSRAAGAVGWAFVIWGTGMYLWSAVLYLIQVRLVVLRLPRVSGEAAS
jgi:cardiolipin synthase